MKRQYVKQIALSAGIALMVSMANATTLYWDADANPANNNVDGTGLGGAGSWSGAGLWWDGVSVANQNWVAGSDAVFAGTAGRIQLGANVSAGSLQFNTVGYIIDLAISNGGATHYTLAATGIGGSNGEILNSSTVGGHATVTLTIASGTNTWGGKIYPPRANVTKAGAGTYKTTGQTGVTSAWGQPLLAVTGGMLQLVDNAGCTADGAQVEVYGGATLDIGNNAIRARNIVVRSGATLTSTGTSGSMAQSSQYSASSYYGTLSGALLVGFAHNGATPYIHPITGTANSFTGGTLLYSASTGTCDVRALANAALGTGRVRIENSVAGNTSWLRFQSALPTLGSLESANAGVKQVMLGCSGATLASATLKATWTSGQNTLTVTAVPWGAHFTSGLAVGQTITSATGNGIPAGATITEITGSTTFKISANTTVSKTGTSIGASPIDTTLSVGSLNQAADTFGGAIGQASGTVGSLTKVGSGVWTLSGANTFTGATRVENGTLRVTHASAGLAGLSLFAGFQRHKLLEINKTV